VRPEAQRGEAFFAYGTLAVADVLEALTGHRPCARPATLPGYARYRVRGQLHPAVVERAGATTDGIVYEGIDPTDWAVLDDFEGDAYERRLRPVVFQGGGGALAFVYLLRRDREHTLTAQGWSIDAFTQRHLRRTVELCRALRAARSSARTRGEVRG
jgi:gamma-glutamylcyclotransferase (GGCT)/AIG2-like uncharacterized protein YtfP